MAVNVFICQHQTVDDTEAPYIYRAGGISAPHYAIRVNRKGYVFLIPEEYIPTWFNGDVNIISLGEIGSTKSITAAQKTVIKERLNIANITETKFSDLWFAMLRNLSLRTPVNLNLMLERITSGERHYIDVTR